MTTYLTIDRLGAHGNNGHKIAKEDFVWSGNGYKKPFGADSTFFITLREHRTVGVLCEAGCCELGLTVQSYGVFCD